MVQSSLGNYLLALFATGHRDQQPDPTEPFCAPILVAV